MRAFGDQSAHSSLMSLLSLTLQLSHSAPSHLFPARLTVVQGSIERKDQAALAKHAPILVDRINRASRAVAMIERERGIEGKRTKKENELSPSNSEDSDSGDDDDKEDIANESKSREGAERKINTGSDSDEEKDEKTNQGELEYAKEKAMRVAELVNQMIKASARKETLEREVEEDRKRKAAFDGSDVSGDGEMERWRSGEIERWRGRNDGAGDEFLVPHDTWLEKKEK